MYVPRSVVLVVCLIGIGLYFTTLSSQPPSISVRAGAPVDTGTAWHEKNRKNGTVDFRDGHAVQDIIELPPLVAEPEPSTQNVSVIWKCGSGVPICKQGSIMVSRFVGDSVESDTIWAP